MRISCLSHGALSICAAVILLGGCGGNQTLSAPPATHIAMSSPSLQSLHLTLSGEALSASTVSMQCYHNKQNGAYAVDFKTSGAASGPLDGTFRASGSWGWNPMLRRWDFLEVFVIKGKHRLRYLRISGAIYARGAGNLTCADFDMSGLSYHWKRGQGTASVIIDPSSFSNKFN